MIETLKHQVESKDDSTNVTDDTILQQQEQVTEPEKGILCKNCEQVITHPSLAIEPHEHTFRNPVGISFHILCFSDAPGAIESGEKTAFASWFEGYEWTFAFCSGCRGHLGWWYVGQTRFAGLIATRLIR